MFSHQTSERFEKERPPSNLGPGSYALPSTLDTKGVVISESGERWQEGMSTEAPGPGEYDPKALERGTEPSGPATATQKRQGSEKENRAPVASAKSLRKNPSFKSTSPREVGGDVTQKQQDLRLAGQLDNIRDELKQKTRENKDLQHQASTKDKKIEEMQKRIEDLTNDRREALRKASDIETELGIKRRQLHEKDQDLLAQQKKHEHLKSAAEEKSKRFEKREEEHRASAAEITKLRSSVESLQDKLSASERDRKAADQSITQQERRSEQLEKGLQEHISVLEESLRREEARRRELEERAARTGAERDQGETELAAERRRGEELQSRIAKLEEEVKAKLAEQKDLMDKQHKLEDELGSTKARSTVQGEALSRAEEERSELKTRAARAEVALEAARKAEEARARELAAESAKVAELEEVQQRFGEAQYNKQKEKLDEADEKVHKLNLELAEERERCEDLERRSAELEERERVALEAAQSVEAQRMDCLRVEGLEDRVRRAEDSALEAEAEVRRWKEWADEQSLRELTAETQRLEEIKRVREDVTRQFEVARQDVIDENKALRQKIDTLESGPEGAATLRAKLDEEERLRESKEDELRAAEAERADLESRLEMAKKEANKLKAELGDARGALDEATRKSEEERKELERSVARAEADASLASDELVEERERLEAQVKALRIQHETALASHSEETEMSRLAEREVAQQREKSLEEALGKTRNASVLCRWRLLTEASLNKQLQAQLDDTWREVRHAARMWRGLANGHERDTGMLSRQSEELERLDSENESLREQNRQVVISMQMAQQELQMSLAETRRLQEREAAYEGEIERLSGRSAELAGHANSKQKIKHLMDIKAENSDLRMQVKKSKQQAMQMEAKLRTSHFFDAVMQVEGGAGGALSGGVSQTPRKPSLGYPQTPGKRQQQQPRTPGRGGDRSTDPLSALADERPEAARRERLEAVRLNRAHSRASERATIEYQHLATMVEQVLAKLPTVNTVSDDGPSTPERNSSEAVGGAEPGALLKRLRELASDLSSGGSAGARLASAAAAGSAAAVEPMPRREATTPPKPTRSSATAQNSPEPDREGIDLSGDEEGPAAP